MTLHLASTPQARNRGPGAANLLFAAALAGACLAGEAAAGPPNARAADAVGAAERGQMKVVTVDARLDTLEQDWQDVYPVAVRELEKDDWGIERADSARGRIVTKWQPIHHRLARLAFGDIVARCAVDLTPIAGGGTQVSMRGGLASKGDLEANPFFGSAESAYRKAAARYLSRVRATLAARRSTAERL